MRHAIGYDGIDARKLLEEQARAGSASAAFVLNARRRVEVARTVTVCARCGEGFAKQGSGQGAGKGASYVTRDLRKVHACCMTEEERAEVMARSPWFAVVMGKGHADA